MSLVLGLAIDDIDVPGKISKGAQATMLIHSPWNLSRQELAEQKCPELADGRRAEARTHKTPNGSWEGVLVIEHHRPRVTAADLH